MSKRRAGVRGARERTAAAGGRIPPRPERAELAGLWLCLAAAAIGLFGVTITLAGAGSFTSIVEGQPTMPANSAVALFVIGSAGALRWREDAGRFRKWLSVSAALFVVALAVGTLVEFAFRVDLFIDQIIDSTERSAPLSATAFSMLGLAIVFLDHRRRAVARPSEWLEVMVGMIGFTSLVSILLGAGLLYRLPWAPRIGVSPATSVGLILASLGLLFMRPRAGFMRVAMSTGPGGVLLRRIAPASILGPALLGIVVLHVLGHIRATADLHVMIAVLTCSVSVLGLVLLAIAALPLNRSHELLESSRAQVRNLVELAPDGIFVADRETRLVEVNDAGCAMLGFEREELIGKKLAEVVPADRREQAEWERQQLLRGGSLVSEWSLQRKDGSVLVAELSGKILPDGRWQGVARDITERRRLERERSFLAEVGSVISTSLDLEAIVSRIGKLTTQSLADMCVVYVVEGVGEPRRLSAVCRSPCHQWICDSLVRLRVDTRRAHDIWSELEANRSVLMAQLTPEKVEESAQNEEHLRALRALDPKSMLVVPLYAHGKLIGAMTLISTDPARVYTQVDVHFAEQIAQRAAYAVDNAKLYEKAQQAIRSRETVLGIVAHDLRNPLGNVLLQASLLRRPEGELERRSLKPVELIERSGHRMSRIIQDLLDVARIEEGKLSVERHHLSARDAVMEAVEAQRALLTAASLELELEIARDVPDVWADRDRVHQIFANLLGNAAKFTPAGGTIIVGAAPKDDDVLFWVADTGVGIPEECVGHVFERFWQARSSGRGGVGLGLLIVKGLVEAHGGSIWVESTPGTGTTFYFTIPRDPRAALHAPERPAELAAQIIN